MTNSSPVYRRLSFPALLLFSLAIFGTNFVTVGVANAADEKRAVRIVTFNAEILTAPGTRPGNISKYRFPYAQNQQFENVAAVIESLDPDVLNLVEVTSREAVDKLVKILHEKGMTDYKGYHLESHDSYTGLDVALISKIEPDEVDGKMIQTIWSGADDPTWRESYRMTSRNGRAMNRTASISRNAMYFMTINGHKLGFFGLHLKSNPSSDSANAQRTAQAAVAQRAIRAKISSKGYLPIVLGDLNDYDPDVPDRDETRDTVTKVLRDIKNFDPKQPGDELYNAAEHIARQKDRYTSHWDWNENGVHDPQDVYTMIDHVLLAKELKPYVKRVFVSRTVAPYTSDHYPVVVDLELPKK